MYTATVGRQSSTSERYDVPTSIVVVDSAVYRYQTLPDGLLPQAGGSSPVSNDAPRLLPNTLTAGGKPMWAITSALATSSLTGGDPTARSKLKAPLPLICSE